MTAMTPDAQAIERVLVGGDLSKLTEAQRLVYYNQVCESLGLNPLTKPFDYITLQGKLTLYARRDATEQLRKIHGVSILSLQKDRMDDLYVVTATAQDKHGRTDVGTGAVALGTLKGEALANAIMKAETKAKRRVTLSICGLGMLDETEAADVRAPSSAATVSMPLPALTSPASAPQSADALTSQAPSPTVADRGDVIDAQTGEVISTDEKPAEPIELPIGLYITLCEPNEDGGKRIGYVTVTHSRDGNPQRMSVWDERLYTLAQHLCQARERVVVKASTSEKWGMTLKELRRMVQAPGGDEPPQVHADEIPFIWFLPLLCSLFPLS